MIAPSPIAPDRIVFGFGPMLPLVAAALGASLLPAPWPAHAQALAILYGALILAFVAGVRRGYGFGVPRVATGTAIAAMLAYFVPAGLAVLLDWAGRPVAAIAILALGYAAVLLLDRRAANAGDALADFARLRPPQMAIAIISLLALLVRGMS